MADETVFYCRSGFLETAKFEDQEADVPRKAFEGVGAGEETVSWCEAGFCCEVLERG